MLKLKSFFSFVVFCCPGECRDKNRKKGGKRENEISMGVDDGVSKATTNNREERHTKIELERRSFAFGMDDEGQVE